MPPSTVALRGVDGTDATILDHGDKFCEVLPPGVNIGPWRARLCEALGVAPAEILACGDAENDVEMLQMAGVGAAMGDEARGDRGGRRRGCRERRRRRRRGDRAIRVRRKAKLYALSGDRRPARSRLGQPLLESSSSSGSAHQLALSSLESGVGVPPMRPKTGVSPCA